MSSSKRGRRCPVTSRSVTNHREYLIIFLQVEEGSEDSGEEEGGDWSLMGAALEKELE